MSVNICCADEKNNTIIQLQNELDELKYFKELQTDRTDDQLNEGQLTSKIDSADTLEQQDVILQADEVGELVRENELKGALLREISIRTAEQATEFEFTIPKSIPKSIRNSLVLFRLANTNIYSFLYSTYGT